MQCLKCGREAMQGSSYCAAHAPVVDSGGWKYAPETPAHAPEASDELVRNVPEEPEKPSREERA